MSPILMQIIKFIQNNFKVLALVLISGFFLLEVILTLETNFGIYQHFRNFSTEFIFTTVIGIITTVLNNFRKIIDDIAKDYDKRTSKLEEANLQYQEKLIREVRRLEDSLDHQVFQLRQLDDFKRELTEISNLTTQVLFEQERQKEQLKQNDRILNLENIMRQDWVDRENLKRELKKSCPENQDSLKD